MRIIEGKEIQELKPIIEMARKVATEATCQKEQRGVVVFRGSEILGRGFNGPVFPYVCNPEICYKLCGLFAQHAERRALQDALSKRRDLNGASVLHVRVKESEIQVSGPLSCPDCSNYMMQFVGKEIELREFILRQADGWTAYVIREADEISRRSRGLLDG